jgi:hypothetical protein
MFASLLADRFLGSSPQHMGMFRCCTWPVLHATLSMLLLHSVLSSFGSIALLLNLLLRCTISAKFGILLLCTGCHLMWRGDTEKPRPREDLEHDERILLWTLRCATSHSSFHIERSSGRPTARETAQH